MLPKAKKSYEKLLSEFHISQEHLKTYVLENFGGSRATITINPNIGKKVKIDSEYCHVDHTVGPILKVFDESTDEMFYVPLSGISKDEDQ